MTSLALRPDLTELAALADGIAAFGTTHNINPAVVSVVRLALEDVVTALAGGSDDIHVRLAVEGDAFVVRVEQHADQAQRGPLDLVASLMDDVSGSYADGRHLITLRKALR